MSDYRLSVRLPDMIRDIHKEQKKSVNDFITKMDEKEIREIMLSTQHANFHRYSNKVLVYLPLTKTSQRRLEKLKEKYNMKMVQVVLAVMLKMYMLENKDLDEQIFKGEDNG